jgi:hypothetical protein
MSIDKTIIPLEAIFAADSLDPNPECDPRPTLDRADVIFGVDVMSGREFLVYGRKTLEEIVATGESRELALVRIGIDQETDELEKLLALVSVVKGSFDYLPGTAPE